MRTLRQIERFLRHSIGLNSEAVGAGGVLAAVQARMRALGLNDERRYLNLLAASAQEQQALIEQVVIPETWFFRDEQPFVALRDHVRGWLAGSPTAPLRLLSIPCSTGEEPYSMAMTLLDAGLHISQWQLDALDVSRVALAFAEAGTYGANSFRSRDLTFRDRFFHQEDQRYRLDEQVRRGVHFAPGNIIDPGFAAGRPPYDIIFFRNLLIYLGHAEQKQALDSIERLLAPAGLLFIGHSEAGQLVRHRYRPAGYPGAFAFLKRAIPKAETVVAAPAPSRLPPRKPANPARGTARPPAPNRTLTRTLPAGTASSASPGKLLDEARRQADGGALEEAGRLCEQALALELRQAEAYFLLGLIRDAEGAEDEAEDYFRKALYLEPNHLDAMGQLALVAERRGDAQAAQRYRERARRATPLHEVAGS